MFAWKGHLPVCDTRTACDQPCWKDRRGAIKESGPPPHRRHSPITPLSPPLSQWGGKWCIKHHGTTHSIKQQHEGEEIFSLEEAETIIRYSQFSHAAPVRLWLSSTTGSCDESTHKSHHTADVDSNQQLSSSSKIHRYYQMDTRVALLCFIIYNRLDNTALTCSAFISNAGRGIFQLSILKGFSCVNVWM